MSTGVSSFSSNTFNIALIFFIKEVFEISPSKVRIKWSCSKSSSGGKFSIQVGAFSLQAGASKTVDEYKAKFPSKKIEYVENGGIYRVYIRGFSSYDDGQNFKAKNSLTNAIVVQ